MGIPNKLTTILMKNAPGVCIGAGIVLAIGSAVYTYKNRSRRYFKAIERRTGYHPRDIILDTQSDATHVLDELNFIIRTYGKATVWDYYNLIGVTGAWTDTHYGWKSLRDAFIKPAYDGFLIVMPRAEYLLND